MTWVVEKPGIYVELRTDLKSPHVCWIPIATYSGRYTLIAYAGIGDPVPDIKSDRFNDTISAIVRKEYLESADGLLVSAIPTEFQGFHPSLVIPQPNAFRKLDIQIDDSSQGQFVLEYPSEVSGERIYKDVQSLKEPRLNTILGLILGNKQVKVRWSRISADLPDISLLLNNESLQPLWG